MSRALKRSLALVTTLVALALALLGGARLWQRHSSPAEPVGDTGFVRVRNAYVDLYATRVGAHVLLFDAGLDPTGAPVKEALRALGAEPRELSHILLTHGHVDHVNGVEGLPPDVTPAGISVGLADAGLLNGRKQDPRLLPRLLARLFETRRFAVTAGLQGASRIPVSPAVQVLAFPAPGHSAGSYVYLLHGVLIAGDAMSYRNGVLEPPPDFLSEDPAQALRSLAALRPLLAPLRIRTVCTGHGGCTPEADTQRLLEALFASAEAATAPPPMTASR